MTQGCATVIKILLFVFNVLNVLFGITWIVLGSLLIHATYRCRENLLNLMAPCMTKSSPYGVPVTLLVFGIVVFVISTLGFWGARRESVCMLITFGILCFVFGGFYFAIAVYTTIDESNRRVEIGYGTDADVVKFLLDVMNATMYLLWVYVVALIVAGVLGIILGCKKREGRLG